MLIDSPFQTVPTEGAVELRPDGERASLAERLLLALRATAVRQLTRVTTSLTIYSIQLFISIKRWRHSSRHTVSQFVYVFKRFPFK